MPPIVTGVEWPSSPHEIGTVLLRVAPRGDPDGRHPWPFGSDDSVNAVQFDEFQEFGSRLRIAEAAFQRARDGIAVVLFDAPLEHAQMGGLDDTGGTTRAEGSHQGAGYLGRHAFLDLKATGEYLHQPSQFGKTYDA